MADDDSYPVDSFLEDIALEAKLSGDNPESVLLDLINSTTSPEIGEKINELLFWEETVDESNADKYFRLHKEIILFLNSIGEQKFKFKEIDHCRNLFDKNIGDKKEQSLRVSEISNSISEVEKLIDSYNVRLGKISTEIEKTEITKIETHFPINKINLDSNDISKAVDRLYELKEEYTCFKLDRRYGNEESGYRTSCSDELNSFLKYSNRGTLLAKIEISGKYQNTGIISRHFSHNFECRYDRSLEGSLRYLLTFRCLEKKLSPIFKSKYSNCNYLREELEEVERDIKKNTNSFFSSKTKHSKLLYKKKELKKDLFESEQEEKIRPLKGLFETKHNKKKRRAFSESKAEIDEVAKNINIDSNFLCPLDLYLVNEEGKYVYFNPSDGKMEKRTYKYGEVIERELLTSDQFVEIISNSSLWTKIYYSAYQKKIYEKYESVKKKKENLTSLDSEQKQLQKELSDSETKLAQLKQNLSTAQEESKSEGFAKLTDFLSNQNIVYNAASYSCIYNAFRRKTIVDTVKSMKE